MCGVFKKNLNQLTAVSKFECHKFSLHTSLATSIQKLCALRNISPYPRKNSAFLDMLSGFSIGILPEGIAVVGAFPNLYGSR